EIMAVRPLLGATVGTSCSAARVHVLEHVFAVRSGGTPLVRFPRMEKRAIAVALEESGLLVPELLSQALAANERAKFYLSLIQIAKNQADMPEMMPPDLSSERERVGISDRDLDRIVENSSGQGAYAYRIPRLSQLTASAIADVDTMLAPLKVAGA